MSGRSPRICPACGRGFYNIGRLCRVCAAQEKLTRQVDPTKIRQHVAKPDARRNPAHLDWIRTLPCSIRGCQGKAQAAHVRQGTGGGTGLKPPDRWCVPLCHQHHQDQHTMSHPAFDAKHGVDLRALAEKLAAASPYLGIDPHGPFDLQSGRLRGDMP